MKVQQPSWGLAAHPGAKISQEDFQKARHTGRYAASVGRKVTTNPYVSKELRDHWASGWAHQMKHGARDDTISNAQLHLRHQGFAMRNSNTRLDAAQESLDKLHEHVSELEDRADALGAPPAHYSSQTQAWHKGQITKKTGLLNKMQQSRVAPVHQPAHQADIRKLQNDIGHHQSFLRRGDAKRDDRKRDDAKLAQGEPVPPGASRGAG